jgi:hypothetical protein
MLKKIRLSGGYMLCCGESIITPDLVIRQFPSVACVLPTSWWLEFRNDIKPGYHRYQQSYMFASEIFLLKAQTTCYFRTSFWSLFIKKRITRLSILSVTFCIFFHFLGLPGRHLDIVHHEGIPSSCWLLW